MMGDSDKKLMKVFLDYLLELIKAKDSVIINPLNRANRENILGNIFKKPGIFMP